MPWHALLCVSHVISTSSKGHSCCNRWWAAARQACESGQLCGGVVGQLPARWECCAATWRAAVRAGCPGACVAAAAPCATAAQPASSRTGPATARCARRWLHKGPLPTRDAQPSPGALLASCCCTVFTLASLSGASTLAGWRGQLASALPTLLLPPLPVCGCIYALAYFQA